MYRHSDGYGWTIDESASPHRESDGQRSHHDRSEHDDPPRHDTMRARTVHPLGSIASR